MASFPPEEEGYVTGGNLVVLEPNYYSKRDALGRCPPILATLYPRKATHPPHESMVCPGRPLLWYRLEDALTHLVRYAEARQHRGFWERSGGLV